MFWSLAAILSMAASVLGAQPQSDTYQQLLRQGDWAGYGEEIKKLGDVLKRMPTK